MLHSLAVKVSQIRNKTYSDYKKDSFTLLMKKIEKDLSKHFVKSYKKNSDFLIIDAHAFLHKIKPDIERWLEMQKKNLLTLSDVEFLISDKKEKASMHASEYINLSQDEISEIKDYMTQVINNTLRKELPF